MQNFVQYAPTEIVFGRDTQHLAGKEVKKWGGSRVLLVYGGGSVVRSGLLKTVEDALEAEGIAFDELGGVQPNPRLALAEEGVKKALAMGADFILAVGGGSVIDTAKAIGHGAGNPQATIWDIWMKKAPSPNPLPVGCILTIPAAGSETSDSAVLTNESIGKKAGLNSEGNRCRFAIMNPELAATLPKFQIACGVVDIMMHTLERYFIPGTSNQVTDEIAEGLLRVMVENGPKVYADPEDYDAMSEVMWSGSLSHNNLTELGRGKDFAVHKMGHALGAKFDKAHGATLSALWGFWAEYVYENDIPRFCRYAQKVWGIHMEDERETAEAAIRRTVEFFRELEMPVNLEELGVGHLSEADIQALALDATSGGTVRLSKIKELDVADVEAIYRRANGDKAGD